jgi:hypothetical protein
MLDDDALRWGPGHLNAVRRTLVHFSILRANGQPTLLSPGRFAGFPPIFCAIMKLLLCPFLDTIIMRYNTELE